MLTDKTLLITGATGGIGKSVARFCAQANATIILLASNEKALEQVHDELCRLSKHEPLICTFNLESATAENYHDLKESIATKVGKLDGIVHCAGKLLSLSPLEHTSLSQWHRLIQINLNARFALTQTLLPLLRQSESAHLLFVLSNRAFMPGQAYWSTYQITEKATLALLEMWTEELTGTPVKVNGVRLKDCQTKLRRDAYPFEENPNLHDPSKLDPYWQMCFDKNIQHGDIITMN